VAGLGGDAPVGVNVAVAAVSKPRALEAAVPIRGLFVRDHQRYARRVANAFPSRPALDVEGTGWPLDDSESHVPVRVGERT